MSIVDRSAAPVVSILVLAWSGSATAQSSSIARSEGSAAPAAPAPLAPAAYFASLRRAESSFDRGDRARAAPLFAQLWRQNPEDGSLALRAGVCYSDLGDAEHALPLLEAAYDGGWYARYEIAHRLARACAQLDRKDEALAWLERCVAARYVDRPSFARDPEFAKLRDDERFRRVAGIVDAARLDRAQGWGLDLDTYESEVLRMHAAPTQPARDPRFHRELEELRRRLGELSDEEVALELQRITALLGDGHSVFRLDSSPRVVFASLPLSLYLFSDGLFVLGGTGEASGLAGREVLQIGARSTAELLAAVKPYVSHDNDVGALLAAPNYLTNVNFLKLAGAVPRVGPVTLTLRPRPDPVGRAEGEESVTLELAPYGGDFHQPLAPPPGRDASDAPVWLRHAHEPFWIEELPDDDLLYAQINQIGDAPKETLAAFAERLRATLVDTGFGHLALDLRLNGGGDNFLVWPVVRVVAWFEECSPEHRTFVLTGRQTFSACQNLLNQIGRATNAIVVGEPSGSKPNFTGESTQVLLPWSGLRASISSRWWQDSFPEDERPWIPPQIPVRLSAADYFAGKDPALEAIEQVILAGT